MKADPPEEMAEERAHLRDVNDRLRARGADEAWPEETVSHLSLRQLRGVRAAGEKTLRIIEEAEGA